MPDFIPKAALDYIKNKTDKVGFSYKDVWHEEHASAFTVAKAMQLDIKQEPKPKKEYLTQKKLEDNIAAIDLQIKNVKGKKSARGIRREKGGVSKTA